MHELPVTESILEIATRHAQQANAERVTMIQLVIGDLASIVDDSVRFYWDMISEGTICEGAELHFRRVQTRMACLSCGAEFSLTDRLQPCPQCGEFAIRVLAGEEFYLDSIEIERTTPP